MANRTSQIHEYTPSAKWRHVPTNDNPADIGTRGCSTKDLISNSLWWNGRLWLTAPENNWPKIKPFYCSIKKQVVEMLHTTSGEDDILQRFSSYTRALRVISYVFRFFFCTHKVYKLQHKYDSINLTLKELNFTKTRLVLISQRRFYLEEYDSLSNSMPISKKR